MSHPLYIAFIWHMHQPYYRDLATGACAMPWVRLHATKDYLDMLKRLERFPNIHQTFNIVPSLLDQLEEYLPPANRSDEFLDLSRKPAGELIVVAADAQGPVGENGLESGAEGRAAAGEIGPGEELTLRVQGPALPAPIDLPETAAQAEASPHRCGSPRRPYPFHGPPGALHARILEARGQGPDPAGGGQGVIVREEQQFPARLGRAAVAGVMDSAPLFADATDPSCKTALEHLPGPVGGPVVDDDDLIGGEGLRLQGLQAAAEQVLMVPGREDDRDASAVHERSARKRPYA